MKKIFRFLILAVIFSLSFVLLYSILPAIVWIFGGSFKDVSQHFAYCLFGGVSIIVGLGCVFAESFNEDFYQK
jgi:ABC-type Na+ efflux pump permease subunit